MENGEFTRIVRAYRSEMYRIAFCYTKNHADAEDVTQEAFLKLYRGDNVFESDEACKAWLVRVTINCAKDLLKSRWYRFSLPLTDEYRAEEDRDGELLDAVMRLSRKYREVLFLFYYEGYDTAETARLLGIKQSAVTTRLSRGREQLKRLLEDERGCNYVQKHV